MLRPIFAFLFLFGLVANASSVNAAVEAELSGSVSPAGEPVASEMVPEESQTLAQSGIIPESVNPDPFPMSRPLPGPVVSMGETEPVQVVTAEAAPAPVDPQMRTTLAPMVGASNWVGRWNTHITNDVTVGLVLEHPLSRSFSLEAEGSYARHGITYSYFSHNFDLYGIGGNGKLYLMRGTFNPYIGGGILGLYYSGMSVGPSNPYAVYDHWLGSGQLMAGGDIALSREISIGVRGAYVRPLFNQPATYHNGVVAFPGYEESSAINSAFFRLMGAVRIAL